MSMPMAASKGMTGFASALRVNHSLTAAVEKRALEAMAGRMPKWVSSDQLTILGLAAQLAAGVAYALSTYNRYALLLVNMFLVLNWFGDSMDGTLARVRRQQRPRYGFYVDHMVDVFGAVALMCGLALSGFIHWLVAIAMLIGFLLLASESYLAAYTLTSFEMSHGFFGPTEIRVLLVVGNLALLHSPYANVFGYQVFLFDLGGAFASAGMLAMVLSTTVRHTAQLYRLERIVKSDASPISEV